MNHNQNDIRYAAQSIYDNIGAMHYSRLHSDLPRSTSINLVTEEYLNGYMQDGRMSVVRRFFCLFVTFDLFFIALLWLICILITGSNIYDALKIQVLHYTIYQSVFDIVVAAICRFIILLLFYGLIYINHWFIIAFSTSGSCIFLISKVFVFDWAGCKQPVFEVVLILTSFVLAWGEAWFFDGRVLPQERHARNYFLALTSDRSPLIAPTLLSTDVRAPQENASNFYSPFDTNHNSDEEDEQNDEYRNMGIECVRKAYDLLQSKDWKPEKVTNKGDTIQSLQRDKLGKIYRLTGRIKYPAKLLLEELFYKIEDVPKWNPTLLESKIIRKIDTHTDISYQATMGAGNGIVQSRDFVNLRCWRLCRNGNVVVDSEDEEDDDDKKSSYQPSTAGGSVSTLSEDDDFLANGPSSIASDVTRLSESNSKDKAGIFKTLSRSLGAKDFHVNIESEDPPPLDEEFSDARDTLENTNINEENLSFGPERFTNKMYISAAASIDYAAVPNNPKYIRGQNLVSCWAMREIEGKSDVCIFEWLLCLNLKGFIPRYILETVYTTLMQDYMIYLRKYCHELRQKRRKVPQRS